MPPRRNRRQLQNLTGGATTIEILDGGTHGRIGPLDPPVIDIT